MIWISAYKFKGLLIFEPIDAFIPLFVSMMATVFYR